MPILLGLLAGLLLYSGTGFVFDLLWGAPVRPGALTRELQRISPMAVRQNVPAWRRWGEEFFHPPDTGSLTRPLLLAMFGAAVLGLLFTRSLLPGLLLTLIVIPYRYYLRSSRLRQRRELLNLQFKEALVSVASSLRTGCSLATAVQRCGEDIRRVLRGQPNKPMLEELDRIGREMELGATVEQALIRFRDRAALEDVTNFVNAALLCKVRGGNLPEVMATIAQIISDKMGVRRQVQVLTAGKRMEATVLTGVPPVLVVALTLTSPDYLAPMFHTLLGQILMVVGVILLVLAHLIGRKVVEIEV